MKWFFLGDDVSYPWVLCLGSSTCVDPIQAIPFNDKELKVLEGFGTSASQVSSVDAFKTNVFFEIGKVEIGKIKKQIEIRLEFQNHWG